MGWLDYFGTQTVLVLQAEYSRHVNDPEVLAQTHEGVVARVIWVRLKR